MEKENKKETQKLPQKIQWHPAFVAAMKLDLREYSDYLHFESEHVLNKAPIVTDLLLIKKENISMENHDWGDFFEKHNLFEYKGIGDILDWKVFSKGLAYAYLYASQEKTDESRKWDELTLTFLRRARPIKLLKLLKNFDFLVEKVETGVYHISNGITFKVQIIVLKEVSFDKHPWLAALASDLTAEKLKELFRREKDLINMEDKDNAAAVMEVITRANKNVLRQMKGDEVIVGEAMMELMKPEIDALLDAEMAKKDAEMAEKLAEKLAEKDAEMAEKVAAQAAEIEKLKAQIENLQGHAV